jgi:V8-like Glu-specific endopeptidase
MHKLYKLLSIVGLVFLMMGCSSSLRTPVRAPDGLHQHIGAATVALVRIDADGDVLPFCTGVWISQTEILTAGHCIVHDEDGDNFDPSGRKVYYVVQKEVKEVVDDPAALHLGKVKAFEADHDLALIVAVAEGIPPHEWVEFASEMPGLGEHVFVVGHPRGMYWSFTEGTVSAYRNESTVGKVVQVNATVWYGNSGGGVFDADGKLLGICSRLTRVPQMNYFVHLDNVKKFVKEVHSPTPSLGK